MTPKSLIEPARHAGTALLRSQSDARLVDLTRDGNERAFEAIVQRYSGALLRYCSRLLPPARAEDAVQQAFLSAHRAIHAGDAELHLRPWLYRIAHNSALNLLRQNGFDHDQVSEEIDGVETPAQAFERGERLRTVVAAVQDLPERQRNAIVLQALEGRSYEEIALELGVSDGAVRQLLNRARVTLRQGATALTPTGLLTRFAGGEASPVAERIAQVVAGAGGGALLAKAGAAIVVAGAVAGGAAVGGGGGAAAGEPARGAGAVARVAEAPGADGGPAVRLLGRDGGQASVAGRLGAHRDGGGRDDRGGGGERDDDRLDDRGDDDRSGGDDDRSGVGDEDRSGPGGDDDDRSGSGGGDDDNDRSGSSGGGDDDRSGPGSGSGSDDDSSGPGSGGDDDRSGSGNDSSGSGSSGSGSGGSSGSGSGDSSGSGSSGSDGDSSGSGSSGSGSGSRDDFTRESLDDDDSSGPGSR